MSQVQQVGTQKRFHVQVGLAECTVRCQSESEAVRMARTQLGERMPQMWDVIQGIADKEFRVDAIG